MLLVGVYYQLSHENNPQISPITPIGDSTMAAWTQPGCQTSAPSREFGVVWSRGRHKSWWIACLRSWTYAYCARDVGAVASRFC